MAKLFTIGSIVLICLFCFSSCQREQSTEKATPISLPDSNSKNKIPSIDTGIPEYVVVSYDSLRAIDSINSIEFETVAEHEMTAWLLEHSKHTDLSEFYVAGDLFGTDYATIYENYSQIKFPRILYEKIFPSTDTYLKIQRRYFDKGTKRSRTKLRVTSYYGTRVTEERKYSQLYSIHEMENYFQLIFTAPAKYSPDLHLVTVSKNNLQLIDEQLIYHSFVDAGETDITKTKFTGQFNEFETMLIKNHKNWGAVDTTIQNFIINSDGQIRKT